MGCRSAPKGSPPLNPTAAAVASPFLFALQTGGDAQLGPLPEPVDLSAEVGRQHRRVEDQQGFVVLVGGTRAPVKGADDHGAVVDHGELVWLGT